MEGNIMKKLLLFRIFVKEIYAGAKYLSVNEGNKEKGRSEIT